MECFCVFVLPLADALLHMYVCTPYRMHIYRNRFNFWCVFTNESNRKKYIEHKGRFSRANFVYMCVCTNVVEKMLSKNVLFPMT